MQGILYIFLFCAVIIALFFSIVGIPIIPIYLFLVFHGAEKRKESAELKLKSALMPDEQILEKAIQHRVFGLLSRRKSIAITNSRIILISRGLLGGFVMRDIQWKDLDDAKLSENILPRYCGSRLEFEYTINNAKSNAKKGIIVSDGIPVDIATNIYSKAQQEEHAWEEKRRIRDLEEKRALSGGITLHNGLGTMPPQVPSTPIPVNNTIYSDIEKIKQLLDMGAISDSEYQEMKSKILSRNF